MKERKVEGVEWRKRNRMKGKVRGDGKKGSS